MGTNARGQGPLLLAVAAELRGEVARQQLSRHDLATRSGVPYATVQKSLAGSRMIDVVELGKMCEALGVAPSEMLARAERGI